MTPGLLVIETTAGRRDYLADRYVTTGDVGGDAVGHRWLHVERGALTVALFNVAHVIRIEWARRPGVARVRPRRVA